jgi:hypothetical protein
VVALMLGSEQQIGYLVIRLQVLRHCSRHCGARTALPATGLRRNHFEHYFSNVGAGLH